MTNGSICPATSAESFPGGDSSPAGDRSWQKHLASAHRGLDSLAQALAWSADDVHVRTTATNDFPVVLPESLLQRALQSPESAAILRQFVPSPLEFQPAEGFVLDPVGEHELARGTGLLQKYAGRALLVVTSKCAVHCRYCFRRTFPYDEQPSALADFEPALAALEADPAIEELILSGGDPLTRTDAWLDSLWQRIDRIATLARLRIHTRIPIVLPERITEGLCELFARSRLPLVLVVHTNHPEELDGPAAAALARLRRTGAMLLNQSVLLRGVNDEVDTLARLSRKLLDCGVLPYYLHQLDRVVGAAHFEVPVETGRRIVEELRSTLPGYLVPRYVQELPGLASKEPLT